MPADTLFDAELLRQRADVPLQDHVRPVRPAATIEMGSKHPVIVASVGRHLAPNFEVFKLIGMQRNYLLGNFRLHVTNVSFNNTLGGRSRTFLKVDITPLQRGKSQSRMDRASAGFPCVG
jgi:hypothetical protein